MDLAKEILKEHSKAQTNKLVDYVGNNPSHFKVLVDAYLKGPYRVTQRAAWPLSICAEKHPKLISPHLKKLLDFLSTPGIHNSVKRNTMRLLQFINIPTRYYGQVTGLCFEYLQDKKEQIAVKVFAMVVLTKIINDEPDLTKELKIIIEDQMAYGSPGFISRGRKVLKVIEALDSKRLSKFRLINSETTLRDR